MAFNKVSDPDNCKMIRNNSNTVSIKNIHSGSLRLTERKYIKKHSKSKGLTRTVTLSKMVEFCMYVMSIKYETK